MQANGLKLACSLKPPEGIGHLGEQELGAKNQIRIQHGLMDRRRLPLSLLALDRW